MNEIGELVTKMRAAQGEAQDILPKYQEKDREASELRKELVDRVAEEVREMIMKRYGIDIPKWKPGSEYIVYSPQFWKDIYKLSIEIVKCLELSI